MKQFLIATPVLCLPDFSFYFYIFKSLQYNTNFSFEKLRKIPNQNDLYIFNRNDFIMRIFEAPFWRSAPRPATKPTFILQLYRPEIITQNSSQQD